MNDLVHTEPTEVQAADAHEVQERIRTNLGQMKQLWIQLAEDLYHFHTDELWRSLGYASFEAWLATPEIELERRWVYELIGVYRTLVIERQVEPAKLGALNVSKVREILPALRRGHVTVEEALADAEALGRDDLRTRYQQMSARSPADPEPPIEPDAEPEYATCPACGGRYLVRRA